MVITDLGNSTLETNKIWLADDALVFVCSAMSIISSAPLSNNADWRTWHENLLALLLMAVG